MNRRRDGDRDGQALTELRKRLAEGMRPDLAQARPDFAAANDTALWRSEGFAEALRGLDPCGDRAVRLTHRAARAFGAYLAATPEARRALAYQPHELLDRLPALLGRADLPPLKRWRALAVAAETLWDCLDGQDISDDELHRLRPVAARNRFLVLSEPFRHRGSRDGMWTPGDLDRDVHGYRHHPDLDAAFGIASWADLVSRANEARQHWQHYLDTYQSHPLLAHATSRALEAEVRALSCPDHYRDGPLILSDTPLRDPAHPHTTDTAVLTDTVEHHLLPRFALIPAITAALHRGQGIGPFLFATTVLLAGSAALCLIVTGHYTRAPVPAALAYTVIGAGTLFHGRKWAMPWLLRLPAASAAGLIVLIALHPDWWSGIRLAWPVPAVLIGAAYGYLLIESRNHGVGPGPGPAPDPPSSVIPRVWRGTEPYLAGPGRALAVTLIGLAHAFLTAVIGMTVLAPAFSEKGDQLAAIWNTDTPDATANAILITATAWCLAAGVFSQILWDDRPITAPLAHLRWRNER